MLWTDIVDFITNNIETGLGGLAVILLWQFKGEVKRGFADLSMAQRETNAKVNDHEKRITKLEEK